MEGDTVYCKALWVLIQFDPEVPAEAAQGVCQAQGNHREEEQEDSGAGSEIPGRIGEELKTKLGSVLQRNPGHDHIKTISSVLSGTTSTIPEGMSPGDVTMFKYCPTASMDVERSFSMYNILSDKRQSLTKENLKKIMMCHCHYSTN